ncbi:MAG: DUF2202 domain-containing protein [Coriobacteriia bacterium]|nr:DUF2202 domain-containing protein [Coriobacteriia bacterium]
MKLRSKKVISALAVMSLAGALALPSVALARYDTAPRAALATVPATTPVVADAQLAADLSFMREEEKLAHDVYTALYEKWGARVFTNIAASEQRHTDTIALLLERYGVDDPSEGKGIGEFSDPELQKLHDDLVARGSVSLTEALKVGKLIEEVDIADLDERIARTTQADVLAVYKNLRAGSVNHLRAFNAQLSGTTGGAARGRRVR